MTAPGLTDLAALTDEVRRCRACPELAATRNSVVVGDLHPGAPLLFVGEAPGADEDRLARPFVGRAGRLLDELLAGTDVPRDSVSVLNVVKCRPPGNRAPTRAEVGSCRGWLEAQIRLLAPRVVVTLGGTAAAWAFGKPVRLGDVRGRSHALAAVPAPHVVPTYHPSAALRFGPRGEPRRLLALDIAFAADLAARST